MNLNVWFYTFSTAAQVLAALAGLFSVFVVYKIQDFGELLEDARVAMAHILSFISANTANYSPIKMEDMIVMKDRKILEIFAELLILREVGDVQVSHTQTVGRFTFSLNSVSYDHYARLVIKKERIVKKLRLILLVSLVTIALCLVSLVATDFLANQVNLWLSLALFLLVLWMIGFETYEITIE